MAYERKFDKVDLTSTYKRLDTLPSTDAWKSAAEHVRMGIAVTPVMVHKPTYVKDAEDNDVAKATYDADRIEHGAYVTESGRDGQFYMVMVDRHNDGDWKSLTPCSDYYAAVEPSEIYENLRKMLEFTKNQPTYVYNAFNGGSQQLRVRIEDMQGISMDTIEGMHMELVLKTSIDKSSNHVLSVMPVTEDGTPILFTDSGKNGFNFKVRHTNKAKAEIVNFNAAVASIANAWNNKIVPYVRFLADGDLSESEVLGLMKNIAEDAKMPKDVTEEMVSACKATIGNGADNGIKIIKQISKVVTDRDVTPMAQQRDAEKVGKIISERVRQLFNKKQRDLGV